ncbi:MAG: hypothetical protein KKA07_11040 [Bacteroidetes bacterium]|nr:hypothetical protein [Bacteroidota bacterium]
MRRITFFIAFIASLTVFQTTQAQTSEKLNKIAALHYSQDEVKVLTDSEIKAINFYYSSSYITDTSSPVFQKYVSEHDGIFDVSTIELHRKQSQRVKYRSELYPGLVIELLSHDELLAEYQKLSQ